MCNQDSSCIVAVLSILCIFFFSQILFVDPTIEEENLATGVITIVTTLDSLCLIRKPGRNFLVAHQYIMMDTFSRPLYNFFDDFRD